MKNRFAAIVAPVALLVFGQAPAAEPLRLENGTLALASTPHRERSRQWRTNSRMRLTM